MRESTLARGLAGTAVVCGLWLSALTIRADAAERVQIIKLRGGELHLVNNDERKPKAVINGKEFLFLPNNISHKATYRLSDRDIVILAWDEEQFDLPPSYRVFSLRTDGVAEEIEAPTFEFNHLALIAKKMGDSIHFDLGYDGGLKHDAVLSPKGLEVLKRPVKRPAYDHKDCKWLYEQALGDCITNTRPLCDLPNISSATMFGMWRLRENPRWKIAEDKLDAICDAACRVKKRPAYSRFAKDVCGP